MPEIKYLFWNKLQDEKLIIGSLQRGEVVVGTTDTVVGLLALPTAQGFNQLNTIKGRQEKPYLLIVPSVTSALQLIDVSESSLVRRLMDACWPGPLTIIAPMRRDVSLEGVSFRGKIAVRMPKHEGLLRVLAHTGPLFSTSANKAGEPTVSCVQKFDSLAYPYINYGITESNAVVCESLPSTIVDSDGECIKIVREGAYSKEDLQKIASVQ